ncbi:MAG: alpha/beta hydrolase [Ignavibacteria bacterium]|nr:alpha/beta hydrolase [Ignavibacteria bacterium]
MVKALKYSSLLVLLLLSVLFVTGEKPDFAESDPVIQFLTIPLDSLDMFIEAKESQVLDLKGDNQARIIWADSLNRRKTEYSLVYLHGFSASQEEGDPLHEEFAQRFGCNLFLSRLEDHGRLDSNSLKQLTPSSLLASAKEAIAIGQLLGDKVIVMSCSTGGTLSAYLLAHNPWIYGQIMYSPNIDLYDTTSEIITLPWGKSLLKMSLGGEYKSLVYESEPARYWNTIYHMDGILALKWMIEKWMVRETFVKINQPTLVACYYKDRKNQDKVVSVRKMRKFYNLISTPSPKKSFVEIANAGSHAICSKYFSEDLEAVRFQTFQFAEKILKLKPFKRDVQTVPGLN